MTLTAYKHIAIGDDGQPVIEKPGFQVKQLILERAAYGFSPEELQSQHPQLTLAQIYSALAYYEDHRQVIDAQLAASLSQTDHLQASLDATGLKAAIKARSQR
jgi:uncharacterized protein (DUF433 family)